MERSRPRLRGPRFSLIASSSHLPIAICYSLFKELIPLALGLLDYAADHAAKQVI
jgi:hypothetical protein